MIFICFSFVLRRSRIRPGYLYLLSMKQNRYKQQYAHSKQYVAGHPCSSFFLCTHGKNQGCWPTTLLLYGIFNFQLGKGSPCTLKKLPGTRYLVGTGTLSSPKSQLVYLRYVPVLLPLITAVSCSTGAIHAVYLCTPLFGTYTGNNFIRLCNRTPAGIRRE